MELYKHSIDAESCWFPYQNHVGEKAKADQLLLAQQETRCNSIREDGGGDGELMLICHEL